jgi:hypothetical protein
MPQSQLLAFTKIPDSLLNALETRDVVLWLRDVPPTADKSLLARFLGLPWKAIISETSDKSLLAVAGTETSADPMVRKRGFFQIIDSDPSRFTLPERSLPLYLLNGRGAGTPGKGFEDRLRQMTMLEALRRAAPRDVLVLSHALSPLPDALVELWQSDFRTYLTFVSPDVGTRESIENWVATSPGNTIASFLQSAIDAVMRDVLERYQSSYPLERKIIRVRDSKGGLQKIDVTDFDDPQRPIFDLYETVEERWLSPLIPSELSELEFVDFFKNSADSWRPFAAGVPWLRDSKPEQALNEQFKRIDTEGADANRITYIMSESGAGGTTLARTLAWHSARNGYPVMLARQLPFLPDPLPVANFLTRVQQHIHSEVLDRIGLDSDAPDAGSRKRYETPWLIVFDTIHWQYREGELLRFKSEMAKAGRPVCLLVVVGSSLPIDFINGIGLTKIAELNHAIEVEDAQRLGIHLNQFLSHYGKQKSIVQWDHFYREHTVRYLEGTAAFWVALSFWIQGQYDLSESIQEWIYKCFKEANLSPPLKDAILRVAALSSERLPLPEAFLPASGTGWPTSQLLMDAKQKLASIGLVRVASDGDKYWALIHDILARLLINAFSFDFTHRDELGLGDVKDPEHLRFVLLRRTAHESMIGERAYRAIGEDFATSIFKIDPDHGHANFLAYWREVLEALDSMPRSLSDSSRLFRHHRAISRRRVAKLDSRLPFAPTTQERIQLLNRAIDDLKFALDFIEMSTGAESNLNLLNSLANAYLDLAEIEATLGIDAARQKELRGLANEATRRAYAESPSNSFTIETYVKNLLQIARTDPEFAVSHIVEALGILFAAINSGEGDYRKSQLSAHADRALEILLQQDASRSATAIHSAVDVLVKAWRTLATGVHQDGFSLSDIPSPNRLEALEILAHPSGRTNLQVIQLTYHLVCLEFPTDFARQLDLIQQLVISNVRVPAQLKLEYAVLLYQCDRSREGDKAFKELRHLWREGEYFVSVPERLHWLRAADRKGIRVVQAVVGSGGAFRITAQVPELSSTATPFRPEEMGMRNPAPGTRFMCCVSFGHNGPFLRPTTAKTASPVVASR